MEWLGYLNSFPNEQRKLFIMQVDTLSVVLARMAAY
jgi:hypothetical protein